MVVTENLVKILNMEQLTFDAENSGKLHYCQRVNGVDKIGKFALIIFLHGAGERGANNSSQLLHVVPDLVKYIDDTDQKVILLAPQCPENHQWVNTPWADNSHEIPENPSVDMQMVIELINSKFNEFDIDRSRVYISGISMGGYGSWDILARETEIFTAGLIVCGGADLATATKLKDIPIQIFHGSVDNIVPTVRSRNMFEALKSAGNNTVTYTEYEGVDHDSWTQTYQNKAVLDWLFLQKKVNS